MGIGKQWDSTTRYFVSGALILASAFGAIWAATASYQMIRRMRWDSDSVYADSRRWPRRSMLIASYFSQYGMDWNSGSFVVGLVIALLGLVFASLIG